MGPEAELTATYKSISAKIKELDASENLRLHRVAQKKQESSESDSLAACDQG